MLSNLSISTVLSIRLHCHRFIGAFLARCERFEFAGQDAQFMNHAVHITERNKDTLRVRVTVHHS